MGSKIALITGCSSGIGMATALRLAKQPGKPFIVYASMRNMSKKADIESQAGSALNVTLFTCQLDVTKEETIVKAVAHIISMHGCIDVLINNAGMSAQSVLEITPIDTVRKIFEVNFFGVVRMTQEVLPIMKKQRSGRIINVSSTMGIVGLPFYEMYNSSKFAVEGLTESMAMQLRHFNIWVSTVQPGPVKTSILTNMTANAIHPDTQREDPRLDPQTRDLFNKALDNRRDKFDELAQPVEEVAKIIHDVIIAPKPHLRNPTHAVNNTASIVKYASAHGDEWVDRHYEREPSPTKSPDQE